MDQGPHYAICFVPAAGSILYRYGSSILGYDCYNGAAVDFPHQFGKAAVNWNELSEPPRGYGFQATLKAPFRLSPSRTERQLADALQSFARLGHAVHRFTPTVALVDGFFAVVPQEAAIPLNGLAASCTTLFDAYRAPMSPKERAQRVALGRNRDQKQNLDRSGDSQALTEFRFRLTLTGRIAPSRRKAINAILRDGFDRLGVEQPVSVDRLALLKRQSADAPFRVMSESTLQTV